LLLSGEPELRQALARRSPAGAQPLMAGSKAGSGR
jgi:hypothetical protein